MFSRPALGALCIALLLAGCTPDRPAGFAIAMPAPTVIASTPMDGAIFHAASGYAPLYTGNRAARVGDLVHVVMVERTQSTKSASSATQRDGGLSISPPTAGPIAIDPNILNSSGSASFNGKGDAAQNSTFRGDLTVAIAEVRSNGTAFIKGEKIMQLSQGDEWIQLSGVIRLADIDADNRISSQQVADARINYAGKGMVQQASRAGWLSRVFNLVSPF